MKSSAFTRFVLWITPTIVALCILAIAVGALVQSQDLILTGVIGLAGTYVVVSTLYIVEQRADRDNYYKSPK